MEVAPTPAPMTVTLDATLSGPTSNTYIDMPTALAMAQNIPGGGDWAAKDEETRNLSLIQATRWLETIDYGGTRCDASQRLKWPRSGATCDGITSDCSGIPYQIQEAEVMLAIQYDKNPGSFPGMDSGGGVTDSSLYVSKNQLGDLVQEFSERSNSSGPTNSCTSCGDALIIQKFPWVGNLLGCWVGIGSKTTGTRVIARVRS